MKKLSKKKIAEIQAYLDRDPVDLTWDWREGLGAEDVTLILQGKTDEVIDEIYENSIEYVFECEKTALQNAADEFDLYKKGEDIDDILEEMYGLFSVPIEIDLHRLIRNTDAYINVRLPVEHTVYWEWYDEVRDELAWWGVNPIAMKSYFSIKDRWYPCPSRNSPKIDPGQMAEVWANSFYGGYWYALLDASTTLELALDGKLKGKMLLKKGARVMIHDYWNGASSTDALTLADIVVDTEWVYNDGKDHYGIQSCCGMVTDAWNGELVDVN